MSRVLIHFTRTSCLCLAASFWEMTLFAPLYGWGNRSGEGSDKADRFGLGTVRWTGAWRYWRGRKKGWAVGNLSEYPVVWAPNLGVSLDCASSFPPLSPLVSLQPRLSHSTSPLATVPCLGYCINFPTEGPLQHPLCSSFYITPHPPRNLPLGFFMPCKYLYLIFCTLMVIVSLYNCLSGQMFVEWKTKVTTKERNLHVKLESVKPYYPKGSFLWMYHWNNEW